MNLSDCYKLLGLNTGSSREEIKASYRRLVRKYHPDVNRDDRQAKEKFIAIQEAYEFLMENVKEPEVPPQSTTSQQSQQKVATPPKVKVNKTTHKVKTIEIQPPLSPEEQKLKWQSYNQLQVLLRDQRYPRAIALVEGLAQRLPEDLEVRQWQAIAYQRTGRHFVDRKQLEKARVYLKKALKIDPHNRSLWLEVERDFRRIEQIY
ncbi:DnaJ domain-containing protein [Phormidium sp. LEGE 05292]|uniref:J domain-containing protein n=1 Tax=[Phormidium] sp. LEGE 05292 TaxID=767427 RepID=UPI00187E6B0B|nr:J domain-containing protein [Phormidium sp. LEGE 05292]MBE9229900.1 DnaJ domain-containing protein [Phormidium sp. LEGE 05292]